jgi:hypothetical protein
MAFGNAVLDGAVQMKTHRISVMVADAESASTKSKREGATGKTPTLRLTQREGEDGPAFAQRVATSVARLGRRSAALERLALVVHGDFGPATHGARSEVLSLLTLHLVRSRTPLTIRFADEEEFAGAQALNREVAAD